jgi:hypothetical protein
MLSTDKTNWIKRIDEISEALAVLRAEVAGDDEPGPVPTVTPAADEEIDWNLRGLLFLKPFYDAPGRSLHKDAARQAALDAGYDPRGTAGFYVGNGSLVKVGDYRVLTDVGADWFESQSKSYPDEFPIGE